MTIQDKTTDTMTIGGQPFQGAASIRIVDAVSHSHWALGGGFAVIGLRSFVSAELGKSKPSQFSQTQTMQMEPSALSAGSDFSPKKKMPAKGLQYPCPDLAVSGR
ncbi:hypothetical protein EP867_18030 [Falsigemmobacter intermedius]|uniref:Uncharacterized protein n=1 Tax=Falsigemmobacter intermedius TaxID=1553448 RepID=A0A3S3ULD2_9RHOB|nr:hypothetical protein EP867_18030 [Falsigemmobacter intermedius]